MLLMTTDTNMERSQPAPARGLFLDIPDFPRWSKQSLWGNGGVKTTRNEGETAKGTGIESRPYDYFSG